MTRITRHLLNLYRGAPGSRRWKRELTERSAGKGAPASLINEAIPA